MKILALLFVACATTPPRPAPVEHPSVHGMLLFGKGPLYVSHLPLYHAPHDWQIVSPVTVGTEVVSKVSAGGLFTIEPERFALSRARSAGFAFDATVYQGHFERGGQKLSDARFVVGKPIVERQLDSTQPHAGRYVVFGARADARYAAHLIGGRPDFDQIVRVEITGPAPDGDEVTVGGDATKPLDVGATVDADWKGRAIQMHVVEQVYLETGDLSE
jgi:hypothetical protein